MRLVLASASPRRVDLLTAAGYVFESCPVHVDESVRPGEAPPDYVRRLAAEKSGSALERLAGRSDRLVVLGADTAVVAGGEILGKPAGPGDARSMMARLSGRRHDVLTGVSVRTAASETGEVVSTAVWFTALSPEDIDWYVGSGEGFDKAGAYAIQGLASRFVTRIEGSYTNVVGLPVAQVVSLLKQLRT